MSAPGSGVDVRRLMDASPERVFAAFADKSLVAQWLRPSPDAKLTVLAFRLPAVRAARRARGHRLRGHGDAGPERNGDRAHHPPRQVRTRRCRTAARAGLA